MRTVQVDPEAQVVAPVHPMPPHCAYFCATAPDEVDVADAEVAVPEAVPVGPELEMGAGAEVGATPPAGMVVGTVAGCSAVFQVAAEGQAVLATAGDAVPNGAGPGIA